MDAAIPPCVKFAYLAAPPAIGTDVEISDQARAIIRINIPPIIHER